MTGTWIDKGEIVMFMRDFSKIKSKTQSDYPDRPVVTVSFTLDTPEEAEAFIIDRLSLFIKYEAIKDDQLPLCTQEERFNNGDKYAVMKKGNKRAVKIHDEYVIAEIHAGALNEKEEKEIYYIEERKGTDMKCLEYCSVNKYCDYYKEN
jgi:hypothetical protein